MKHLTLTVCLFVLASICQAQSQSDPNWPCIQVLIPKISAAAIWDGPVVEDIQQDESLAAASRKIVTDVIDKDQPLTEQLLEDYVMDIGEIPKNEALTYLFKSFLDKLNNKRSTQINTIKRYTRTQRASAASIEKLLDQMTKIQDLPDQTEQLQELEAELHWQKRMFKEREKTFKYLCELPQEIFQQAGEIARTISAKLEY